MYAAPVSCGIQQPVTRRGECRYNAASEVNIAAVFVSVCVKCHYALACRGDIDNVVFDGDVVDGYFLAVGKAFQFEALSRGIAVKESCRGGKPQASFLGGVFLDGIDNV